MTTRLSEPILHAPPRQPTVCAICGRRLRGTYYYFANSPKCYCEDCTLGRARCDSCAAPVGDDGWRLHDGRSLCATCHKTAIYDPAEANALFAETVGRLAAHPGLGIRVGAAFRLIDAPALHELARHGGIVAGPNEHTLGLYQRQGRLRVVYVLYGLPRLLFRSVVAHEYAHVWQGEHCPLLNDEVWREGFAEWVAYQHLLHLGARKAAEQMRVAEHPYQPGLLRCLELERRVGVAGVLEAIRRQE
ncbi:MAG TPA: protein DA1 [Herpetosiphonaceae bacterium]